MFYAKVNSKFTNSKLNYIYWLTFLSQNRFFVCNDLDIIEFKFNTFVFHNSDSINTYQSGTH